MFVRESPQQKTRVKKRRREFFNSRKVTLIWMTLQSPFRRAIEIYYFLRVVPIGRVDMCVSAVSCVSRLSRAFLDICSYKVMLFFLKICHHHYEAWHIKIFSVTKKKRRERKKVRIIIIVVSSQRQTRRRNASNF